MDFYNDSRANIKKNHILIIVAFGYYTTNLTQIRY